MLVKDLIEKLESLPKNSNIGMIDIYEYRFSKNICIVTNKDKIFDDRGCQVLVEDIGKERISNKDNICDYYIV